MMQFGNARDPCAKMSNAQKCLFLHFPVLSKRLQFRPITSERMLAHDLRAKSVYEIYYTCKSGCNKKGPFLGGNPRGCL
jgi:hypothetical protein